MLSVWKFYNSAKSCFSSRGVMASEESSAPVQPIPVIDTRTKPDAKYTLDDRRVRGAHFKHLSVSYVHWQSKRSPDLRKYAVFKESFQPGTKEYRCTGEYGWYEVVKEVFVSRLFVSVLGDHAVKGNFNWQPFASAPLTAQLSLS